MYNKVQEENKKKNEVARKQPEPESEKAPTPEDGGDSLVQFFYVDVASRSFVAHPKGDVSERAPLRVAGASNCEVGSPGRRMEIGYSEANVKLGLLKVAAERWAVTAKQPEEVTVGTQRFFIYDDVNNFLSMGDSHVQCDEASTKRLLQ
eukprot:3746961-Prymnesium_polylepis.1